MAFATVAEALQDLFNTHCKIGFVAGDFAQLRSIVSFAAHLSRALVGSPQGKAGDGRGPVPHKTTASKPWTPITETDTPGFWLGMASGGLQPAAVAQAGSRVRDTASRGVRCNQ